MKIREFGKLRGILNEYARSAPAVLVGLPIPNSLRFAYDVSSEAPKTDTLFCYFLTLCSATFWG